MFDPSSITLGQLSSSIRDFAIVGFLFSSVLVMVRVAWKSRGAYEQARIFIARITHHMDTMENFAQTMVTNHLTHIESDLRTISGRKSDVVEVDDTQGSN